VQFDPSVGTEIRKTRPAVVVSGDLFNRYRSKVTVLPLTSIAIDRAIANQGLPALVEVRSIVADGGNTESGELQ
jgi:mRNA interferase MazF